MSQPILITTPSTTELEPEVIPPEWVSGCAPIARRTKLATSNDWASSVVVWDCTPGQFQWHYMQDECVFVVSGEAFLIEADGKERRFAAGDFGFFPAGTTCNWRVSEHFRKVAVLREPMSRPLGFAFKVTKKLVRALGLLGKPPLMLLAPLWLLRNFY
jgi:uncharacterized protein